MKKDFWINKWQSNQIGFHKGFVHPLLKKYFASLRFSEESTIFIPLCGKSLDMLWLESQGLNVVGVELSQLAIESFFKENNRIYEVEKRGCFQVYHSSNITLYQGDVFDLAQMDLENVSWIYDRAALIALPENLASQYTEHLFDILPKEAQYLLITLEMDREGGPPFSQSEEKIQNLFSKFESCNLLRKKNILKKEPSFQNEGCSFLYEKVHLIQT